MKNLPSSRYATESLGDAYSRHKNFVDLAGKGKEVLELGCSTGFLSKHLVKNGCRVTGVEIDKDAAQAARSYCCRVESININDRNWINEIGASFDVILFGDVLEHLIDPLESLKLSRSILRPGGHVVISLPNVAHWTVRVKLLFGNFNYKDSGILDETHLRFFTRKTALQLIDDAGFSVTDYLPIIGGKLSSIFRPMWQLGATLIPGLLAFQMLFRVIPKSD